MKCFVMEDNEKAKYCVKIVGVVDVSKAMKISWYIFSQNDL